MSPAPFLRALAAACVLLLCAPAWGGSEEAVPAPPHSDGGGAGLNEARVLVDTGRFREALALLGPLLESDAMEADTLFLYGLAAAGASQGPDVPADTREALLDEAIGAFRAMLIERPDLVRVRLELARAFFLKGEHGLARRHFEQVLAGDVPEAVAANVERYLAAMRVRGRWGFNLGFALAPDSNIGSSSEERTFFLYDLPFRLDAEELTTSGVGVSVWGGAEYQVPLSESVRLRAGGETWRREYEGSQFDEHYLSAHVGPRWLVDGRTEVSLLASARQRWLQTVKHHHALGARLEVGHRVSPRVTLSGRASWHGRRHRTRTDLDGPAVDASLRGSWVVTPTIRASLSGGYDGEHPRGESQTNRSRWLGLEVSSILPLGFTVGVGGEVRWTDYEGSGYPYTRDGSSREDRTRSLRASVYNRGFTVYGFSPELVVVREERESNAQLSDYERTRGELRFVRQF